MLKNFFIVAIRNLWRNKVYSLLNIAGLAIGMACVLIIGLYLHSELTYDRWHEKEDRIYRLGSEFAIQSGVDRFAMVSQYFGPFLKENVDGIEDFCRFRSIKKILVRYREKAFYEDRFMFADPSVLDIFSFKLKDSPRQRYASAWKAGGGANLRSEYLSEPNTLLLTESAAEKYFGEEWPIGKVLTTSNRFKYRVTGILEDPPENSHLQFDGLLSYVTLESQDTSSRDLQKQMLWSVQDYTFLLLEKGVSADSIHAAFPTFYQNNMAEVGEMLNGEFDIILEPLRSLHFDSDLKFDAFPRGNKTYIYVFASVGLFILLLACINYMNMATARSTTRAREVGMRKVMGSTRGQLIQQFLGESVLISLIAFILAMALVEMILSLTPINEIVQKTLVLDIGNNLWLLGVAIVLVLLIGIGSGFYPALYLSAFFPIRALKGFSRNRPRGFALRRLLVASQFTISIGVVVCTLLMNKQVDYMRNKNLGFNKENLLLIPLQDSLVLDRYPQIREEFMSHPRVKAVTTAHSVPGIRVGRHVMRLENRDNELEESVLDLMVVDYDYLKTMGIELVEGRDFSREVAGDTNAFLVNETLVREMGWDNAIGKRGQFGINPDGDAVRDGPVIGVMKDFNSNSLHQDIEPLALILQRRPAGMVHIRLDGRELLETMNWIESKWAEFDPHHPFDSYFFDETFNALYDADVRQSRLLGILSYICILISLLGLVGLSSFTTEQRSKEIGVRRVLGASVMQIVLLLFRDIVLLILLALVVAIPMALWFISAWLQDFAFQTHIDWSIFIITGLSAILLAFVTVSFHTFRAAMANPVKTLKYE